MTGYKPVTVPRPDGVRVESLDPDAAGRHASVMSVAILGALLAVGLSGVLGDRRTHRAVENAAGRFELTSPSIVRNGNITESRFTVTPHRDIGQLVIAIDAGLWRDITTNSTEPMASNESFADGKIRFVFDGLKRGEVFEYQVDQQINPNLYGTNRGTIAFLDGKKLLASFEATLRVLP